MGIYIPPQAFECEFQIAVFCVCEVQDPPPITEMKKS